MAIACNAGMNIEFVSVTTKAKNGHFNEQWDQATRNFNFEKWKMKIGDVEERDKGQCGKNACLFVNRQRIECIRATIGIRGYHIKRGERSFIKK